jgi:hypothetical protein
VKLRVAALKAGRKMRDASILMRMQGVVSLDVIAATLREGVEVSSSVRKQRENT